MTLPPVTITRPELVPSYRGWHAPSVQIDIAPRRFKIDEVPSYAGRMPMRYDVIHLVLMLLVAGLSLLGFAMAVAHSLAAAFVGGVSAGIFVPSFGYWLHKQPRFRAFRSQHIELEGGMLFFGEDEAMEAGSFSTTQSLEGDYQVYGDDRCIAKGLTKHEADTIVSNLNAP